MVRCGAVVYSLHTRIHTHSLQLVFIIGNVGGMYVCMCVCSFKYIYSVYTYTNTDSFVSFIWLLLLTFFFLVFFLLIFFHWSDFLSFFSPSIITLICIYIYIILLYFVVFGCNRRFSACKKWSYQCIIETRFDCNNCSWLMVVVVSRCVFVFYLWWSWNKAKSKTKERQRDNERNAAFDRIVAIHR